MKQFRVLNNNSHLVFPIIIVAISGSLLVFLVMCAGLPLNHDAALFLQCAQLIADGKTPFVDYVELNLPLIHYLHSIPFEIAQICSIDLAHVFQLFVVILSLASAGSLLIILHRSSTIHSKEGILFMTAGWIMFSIFTVSSNTFGQREHLFLLAYIPWLYCREARLRSLQLPRWLIVTVSVWLGVQLLVKPGFLIYVLAVECWMWYRGRKLFTILSAEVLLPLGISCIYLLHFLVVPPVEQNALFNRWIPFIIKHYHVYDSSIMKALFLDSLSRSVVPFSIISGLCIGYIFLKRTTSTDRIQIEALMVAVIVGAGLHIWSQKSWTYHLLLSIAPLVLLLVTIAIVFYEDMKLRLQGRLFRTLSISHIFWFIMIGLVLIGGSAWYKVRLSASRENREVAPLVRIIQQKTMPQDAVTFISTNVYPTYPTMIYAQRLPGTRYLSAFPIAMLYDGVVNNGTVSPYRQFQEQPAEERQFLKELGEDIRQSAPRLVCIDTSDGTGCPRDFHVHEYLKQTGWQATYLTQYERISTIGDYDIYSRKE